MIQRVLFIFGPHQREATITSCFIYFPQDGTTGNIVQYCDMFCYWGIYLPIDIER